MKSVGSEAGWSLAPIGSRLDESEMLLQLKCRRACTTSHRLSSFPALSFIEALTRWYIIDECVCTAAARVHAVRPAKLGNPTLAPTARVIAMTAALLLLMMTYVLAGFSACSIDEEQKKKQLVVLRKWRKGESGRAAFKDARRWSANQHFPPSLLLFLPQHRQQQ